MAIDWSTATILVVLTLLVLFIIGVPIAFTFGVVGLGWLYFLASPKLAFDAVGILLYSSPLSFVLLAVPLFIFMAQIIQVAGFGEELYEATETLFEGVPSSLALATIGAGTIFAAACGSSPASCATIGPMALKAMIGRDYNKRLAVGCIAASGGLAIIIPPSILFIIYGFVAETSVAKLFIAGVIPGLLMAACMALYTILRTRGERHIAPGAPAATLKQRIDAVGKIWPLAVIIIIVMGCIYGGVTTPTEAAAIGALGSLILAGTRRKLSMTKLKMTLLASARTTGFILFLIVGALTFGFLMSYLRIPLRLSEAVIGAGMASWMVLATVNIILLILGMFMDSASLLLVVIPILLPTLQGLGFDPIWLGVVLCINIEMGLLTPPVGLNLYILQGIGKPFGVSFGDVVRGSVPYLGAQMAAWLLVIFFPILALWLPNTMMS